MKKNCIGDFMKFIFYITIIMMFLLNPCLSSSQGKRTSVNIYTDFLLPERLVLCGESMPLDNLWVWEMLDRELTIAAWDTPQVLMWFKRAGRYFPFIEKKLAQENMPDDLKYLAVSESALLSDIRSNKGAVGIWQFIADTAERHALKFNRYIDERRDIERSTEAALKYLKELKESFGTWTLAMAAYNCGENRVKKEIEDQQENDFYSLKLPNETERYIFRIAAVKFIMENPEKYGYQVPESKIYKPVVYDTVKINIKKNIHITDFAKAIGTSFKVIRDLNPKLIDDFLPTGTYNLNTPPGTGKNVSAILKSLSSKSDSEYAGASSGYYVVQKGDTLSAISLRTGLSVNELKRLNNIKGSIIKVGDVLALE